MLARQPIGTVPDFAVPIGLIEIASYTRSKITNIEFSILDIAKDLHIYYLALDQKEPISLEGFYKEKLDELDYAPDIIGISILFSTTYKGSLILARLIRNKWPDSLIIAGGNFATSSCDVIFNDTVNIDYIFRGEAEISFTEFVRKYSSEKTDKGNLADIQGVYNRKKYQDHSNLYGHSLELSEVIKDLDLI